MLNEPAVIIFLLQLGKDFLPMAPRGDQTKDARPGARHKARLRTGFD